MSGLGTDIVMETLSQAARRIDAQLVGADAGFARVITDTRQLQRGDLFVALVGPRFDGHDFLARALELGAAGAIVSRRVDVALPQLQVPDTLRALQDYARSWRSDFRQPVVGVTWQDAATASRWSA